MGPAIDPKFQGKSIDFILCQVLETYSGILADCKRQEAEGKHAWGDLVEKYSDLASSLLWQGWVSCGIGVVTGAAGGLSTSFSDGSTAKTILDIIGKSSNSVVQVATCTYQSDQTKTRGDISKKESLRDQHAQGGSSADRAYQSMLEVIQRTNETVKQIFRTAAAAA